MDDGSPKQYYEGVRAETGGVTLQYIDTENIIREDLPDCSDTIKYATMDWITPPGCDHLALAILRHLNKIADYDFVPEDYYSEFSDDIIKPLNDDGFILTTAEIMEWIVEQDALEADDENLEEDDDEDTE